MIDRTHVLPIPRQAKVLNISRGTVYYQPRAASPKDLRVMRRIDELHLERPFAGGWLHTGDLAVVEPDGYVRIKDRSKDVIISGGENISSIELEDVLHRHPAVDSAAVVAKPDPKWGEVPCAFIELRPNAAATEAEIRQFCREQMAGYKVPKLVVFGSIPKNATGKIQKFLLREVAK